MADFIFLMHNDSHADASPPMWEAYISELRRIGAFEGGSAIGEGTAFRKDSPAGPESSYLGGYIRIRADSFEDARRHLSGNPVFESGGTVEIRELPAN